MTDRFSARPFDGPIVARLVDVAGPLPPDFAEHLARLGDAERRALLHGPLGAVGSGWKAHLFGIEADGAIRGAGRLIHGVRAGEALGSLAVEQGWRGQGLGTALAARLVYAARSLGARSLALVWADDDPAMLRIAARFGARPFGAGERRRMVRIELADLSLVDAEPAAAIRRGAFASA
ncbi:MAG: GNAT family N-acetyltransferase [Rhizobiales bacterium]|nr:GNAT family N-acetyltransferase [Hyphomicrobiales bacterium]